MQKENTKIISLTISYVLRVKTKLNVAVHPDPHVSTSHKASPSRLITILTSAQRLHALLQFSSALVRPAWWLEDYFNSTNRNADWTEQRKSSCNMHQAVVVCGVPGALLQFNHWRWTGHVVGVEMALNPLEDVLLRLQGTTPRSVSSAMSEELIFYKFVYSISTFLMYFLFWCSPAIYELLLESFCRL